MAGTITLAGHQAFGQVRKLAYDFVGDAADGSVPSIALPAIEGRLLALETNPGSTAPTDNWDVALNDADGVDRLLGVGVNRDTTNSELAAILFASSSVHPPVAISDTLTLAISGNSVNSATGRVTIYYAPVA